ncbi:MAG TPA: pyridoxamine 5'-phosphate oxidase family protein [Ferruginibacter sp.]|nr:pyridoxamine 5'-phosphate oxidase family protein [Ferruginibacter sp.]
MLRELNEMQINNLLISQSIGRIGCIKGKQPYIIPVIYIYDGKDIYGQSHPGMKIDLMRENPSVCFQVDMVLNLGHWQSVLGYGTFEELDGIEANNAREYLNKSIMPLMSGHLMYAHPEEETDVMEECDINNPTMYRINLKEKTGWFERQ